jgi:hypothetical protein
VRCAACDVLGGAYVAHSDDDHDQSPLNMSTDGKTRGKRNCDWGRATFVPSPQKPRPLDHDVMMITIGQVLVSVYSSVSKNQVRSASVPTPRRRASVNPGVCVMLISSISTSPVSAINPPTLKTQALGSH